MYIWTPQLLNQFVITSVIDVMSRCVNMEAMICLFTSQVVKLMQALRVRGRAVVTYMNKVQEYIQNDSGPQGRGGRDEKLFLGLMAGHEWRRLYVSPCSFFYRYVPILANQSHQKLRSLRSGISVESLYHHIQLTHRRRQRESWERYVLQ